MGERGRAPALYILMMRGLSSARHPSGVLQEAAPARAPFPPARPGLILLARAFYRSRHRD